MPLRPSSRQVWSQDHLLTPVNSACSLSPDNATPAVMLQGSISRPGWPAPTPSQRPSHWQSVPWGLWTVHHYHLFHCWRNRRNCCSQRWWGCHHVHVQDLIHGTAKGEFATQPFVDNDA